MLPTASLSAAEFLGTKVQVTDKNSNFVSSTRLEGGFSDLLDTPLKPVAAIPVDNTGAELPLTGIVLPDTGGVDVVVALPANFLPFTVSSDESFPTLNVTAGSIRETDSEAVAALPTGFVPYMADEELIPALDETAPVIPEMDPDAVATLPADFVPYMADDDEPIPALDETLGATPDSDPGTLVQNIAAGSDVTTRSLRADTAQGIGRITRTGRGEDGRARRDLPMLQPLAPPPRIQYATEAANNEMSPASGFPGAQVDELQNGTESRLTGTSGTPANPATDRTAGVIPGPLLTTGPAIASDLIDVEPKRTTTVTAAQGINALADTSAVQPNTVPARSMPVATMSIDRPVLDDTWGEALQDRVMWMTGKKMQSAEIRLNPAELGPIKVHVSVQDDAAKLTFSAQHALTREAIEQAMPRLREMLGESGLSLAGSTVTDAHDDDLRQGGHSDGQEVIDRHEDAGTEDTGNEPVSLLRIDSSALVDTFV